VAVLRQAQEFLALIRGSLPAWEHQPVVSYSAGRDIAAETESSTTGTKFDIAATDQIRPIATTAAIIHASICIPSTLL
jgi:hypothetical protein